jgi:large subunit ribosomal protein L25
MSMDFVLHAELRNDQGSRASRRLRRAGRLPGILYGGHREPVAISLDHNAVLLHMRSDAFYSHVLTLHLEGKTEKAILRDLQRHPFKPSLQHIDLLRVSAGERIRVHVPLHFQHEDVCVGVKSGGGMVNRQMAEVEVECLPDLIPEAIDVDVAALTVGQSLHLSNLVLPEGVSLVALAHGADGDATVVTILAPRGEAAGEAGAA